MCTHAPHACGAGMTRELVDALVTLPFKERLTMRLMPSALYYRRRLADEAEWGEHELDVLGEIMTPGGTAVDVGANQGFFAYAFSSIAARVEAFEPNPDYAAFARACSGPAPACTRSRSRTGAARRSSWCPSPSRDGTAPGRQPEAGAAEQGPAQRFQVEVRTLDSYGLREVRAVKVDVEGSEMEVLEGGRETILRDRPALIVELLTGAHADPVAVAEAVCATYGYAAWLVTRDRQRIEALPAIRALGSNTTWGSPIRNRNVLFLPRR